MSKRIANCELRITFHVLRFTFYVLFIGWFALPVCAAPSPPIIINEIQYHPLSDTYSEEYIELYTSLENTETLDLTGWQFGDGFDYIFPTGTVMLPGDYLVIAGDPATVQARYGITGVLGPIIRGRLSNSGERVALENAVGVVVDEVTYDDHNPWPGPADGDGPSLELINPTFDNDSPCSWGSSTGLGTPGAQNSVYQEGNLPPCITDAIHNPIIPRAIDPIAVTAQIYDNQTVVSATLHYRVQGEPEYHTLPMERTATTNATYSVYIPPRSLSGTLFFQPGEGVYVEFYITATDDEGATRSVPDGAPGSISEETGNPVTISYLAWIEDTPLMGTPTIEGTLPLYHILLTDQNRTELENRNLFSNKLLDATFVYNDPPQAFYNVGLRYRGESSRSVYPRPYRIKFRDAQEFESRERINLISDNMEREAISHDLFQRAGLPAPDTRFVTFAINGQLQGDYLDVEQIDRDFLKNHFGDDDDGNLYRGIEHADLSYQGESAEAYRLYYEKQTNLDADDFSDIISLTYALTYASDEDFVAEAEAVADMRQWLKWLAMQAVIDNHEGALWLGPGDDYYLYHRGTDDRFILISWDHDTLFMYADHTIWEPDWYAKEIVNRILHHTRFTRWYYQSIAEILDGPFAVEAIYPRIDALPDVISTGDRQEIKDFVADRIDYLWQYEIPGDVLAITTYNGKDIITTEDTITLAGTCSPLRDVTINGSDAGVVYLTPVSWSYTTSLWTRDNVFVVSDGRDTQTLTVFRDTFHGGTLYEDTTLPGSRLPYSIREDIQLSGAITLNIEPGATLAFEPGRMMRVEDDARLLVEGTLAQPVTFTRMQTSRMPAVEQDETYWGGILLYGSRADNYIGHAVIEYVREVLESPRTHGVTAYASDITIADSVFRHIWHSNAIIANYESGLILLRNEFYDIGSDIIHATGGYAYIQDNQIHDTTYDPSWNPSPPEGIELSSMITPAVLLDNHIYNITDDCLDLNHSSAILERNVVHHCGDKGISIGEPASTTLVNNLVYECWGNPDDPDRTGFGIALKDGTTSRLINNTLVNNRHGLGLYEMHAGMGGATAIVTNTIIWRNNTDVAVRDGSSLQMSTSIVGGGWPGTDNLDRDPLFRDPSMHNYRLREGSPAIDSGSPVGAPLLDVQGVPRPKGEGVDRGAYEFFEFYRIYLPLTTRK
ncbi:MAG: CotH kinase family protein [Anaerolineae bacterium]|nr:CotH kinase family protein [Anaerolineae bacterium]